MINITRFHSSYCNIWTNNELIVFIRIEMDFKNDLALHFGVNVIS